VIAPDMPEHGARYEEKLYMNSGTRPNGIFHLRKVWAELTWQFQSWAVGCSLQLLRRWRT
jgi:hypothetical protein